MSFYIYKIKSDGSRLYVTDIPGDENPIGGVGYQSMADGSIPKQAGTSPTEPDAKKVCDYLRTCFYGEPEDHFYGQAGV